MESNREEALRAIAIAQKHRDAGNLDSARRFAEKSLRLFETAEAKSLLNSISTAAKGEGSSSSYTSATETNPSSSGATRRHTSTEGNGASQKQAETKPREYTAENLAVVKRVRACKITEYYEILNVKRDCEENDVKKAYRKLALQLHPDKNGAPGADEAFKMVSKAFQVLSDPQKRAIYDSSGGDPESRFGGGSSGTPGFARSHSGGMAFDGEISPEELFNMFFGGGPMGGGPMGGGPVFTASFGPGGFRTMRMGGGGFPRAQRQAGTGENSRASTLMQLLPLILLFAFSLLNALPSLFSGPVHADPKYAFSPSSRFDSQRTTTGLGIVYHVNSAELRNHPVIGAEIARAAASSSNAPDQIPISGKAMKAFEKNIETTYTRNLYSRCQRGLDLKERRKEREIGFMGIGTDWEKVKAIEAETIPECEELRRFDLIR